MEYAETIRSLFSLTPFIGDADPSTPTAVTSSQLFPFILNPDVTATTSSPHFSVPSTCNSFVDPVKNSANEVVAFLDSSTHVSASSMHGKTCDVTGTPSSGNPTSSLIASIVNRGIAPSSANIASVIISSQSVNTTPLSSTRSATTNATSANSCSILLETSILSSQLSSSQRPLNPTTASSTPISGTTSTSSGLLVSSSGPTVPRFVIHKPSVSHISTPGTGVADSYPVTFVAAPSKAFTVESLPSTSTAPLVSDAACNQPITLTSSKSKLVTSPNPSSFRLLTSPPSKPVGPVNSAGLLQSNALTALQPLVTPLKTAISGPVGIWSGVNNTPAVQPSHLLTVQTSHPLIVQSQSDTCTSSVLDEISVVLSQPASHPTPAAAPSLTNNNSCPVSESTPTVLAFSLTTTTSMGVPGANLINKSVAQHAPAASLVLRATCSPAVAISALPSTPTSVAHYTPGSLLKPFNLSLSSSAPALNTTSTSVTSTTAIVPSLTVPIHIAPAKLPTLQAAPSSTMSINRSYVSPTLSPISLHRHTAGSLFSQPNRRRARKQQLACALPTSTVSTPTASVASVSPLNLSSTPTLSSIPIAHLSSANRTTLTTLPSVVTIAKPAQPQLCVQPRHITTATHNLLSLPLSPKHGGNELAVKVACSVGLPVIPSINGTNSPLSNPAGFVGIRLLSVRPTSVPTSIHPCSLPVVSGSTPTSSLLSSRATINVGADPTPLMVVAPTPVSSGCSQQIRIANPHNSASLDVHPSAAATVYVLTSSAYPVASSGSSSSVTIAQSSAIASAFTEARPATVAASSAYTSAVVLPSGEAGGVLQVRFRPPFSHPTLVSNTSTSNFTPFMLEPVASRPSCQVVRPALHPPQHLNASTSLSSPVSEALTQSKHSSDTVGSLPVTSRACSSSSSTSLLHRHLLSPQNPIHTELFLDRNYPAGGENMDDSYAERKGEEHDRSALDSELSTRDQGKSSKSEGSYPICGSAVDDTQPLPTLKTSNVPSRDFSASPAVDPVTVSGQEEISSEPPSKRVKTDDGSGNSILQSVMHPQDSTKSGVLSAIDPSTGCQWVIQGIPTRPSIMPKPSTRGGSIWKAKSSHFLSPLEVRSKCESRFDRTRCFQSGAFAQSSFTERGTSPLPSVSHRRRTSFQRNAVDTASEDTSASHVSAVRRRLLHDLLSSISRQKELQIVRSPFNSPSILSVTGWRALLCANNLDLLLHSEHHSLSSLESMASSLDSLLHQYCNPYSVASSATNQSQLIPFSQRLSQTVATEFPGGDNPAYTAGPSEVRRATASYSSSSVTEPSTVPPDCMDEEFRKSLETAIDLCKGISQRKCLLIQSIRHLQLLTKELVEHFHSDAVQCVRELDEQFSVITPTKTGDTDSNVRPGSVSYRRSARTSSSVLGTMRRPRVCDDGSSPYPLVEATSSSGPTNSPAGSSHCKGTSHDSTAGGRR